MLTHHQQIVVQTAVEACREICAWIESRHETGLAEAIHKLAADRVRQHEISMSSALEHPQVYSEMASQRLLLEAQQILDVLNLVRNERT